MRRFVLLILVFAFLAAVTGCAGSGKNSPDEAVSPSGAAEKTTSLTIAVDEYNYGLAFNGIFDQFEKEHPEIDVVYELIPDFITENYTPEMRESAIDRLRTQIMAGKGPDIYIDLMHPNGNQSEIELLSDIRLSMESGAL